MSTPAADPSRTHERGRGAVRPLRGSAVPRALLDDAATVTEALAALATRFPEHECLVTVRADGAEARWTMAELWTRARGVAAGLRARGVAPGQVVLVVMQTGLDLAATYFGAMLAGAVPALVATPSNRFASTDVYLRRLRPILDNAAAAALVVDAEVAPLFAAQRALLGATTLVAIAELATAAAEAPPHASGPDDLASIQYSSGSTGTPKGVLLTHRAMLANLRALRDGLALTSSDVSANWVPLYHDMGLIGGFLFPLLCGCPTVLMSPLDFLRKPVSWLRVMQAYRATMSWAPNFAYALCTKRIGDADLAGLDLASWRLAINASEPVVAATIDAFTRRFAPSGFAARAMTPVWGMAETVIVATTSALDRPPRVDVVSRRGLAADAASPPTDDGDALPVVAVGRCLVGCAVAIRDPAGQVLPDRRVGDVWLRSDGLFTGYKGDAEHTRKVLVEGWFDTGDRGYLVDGELFFVARAKDVIVFAGDKYAPQDVEAAVNRVPGVREGCAVAFGVLSEERGTDELVVVAETRELDEAAQARIEAAIRVEVHAATGLGVHRIVLVPPGGVEKTTSGKLARQATRERYRDRLERALPIPGSVA